MKIHNVIIYILATIGVATLFYFLVYKVADDNTYDAQTFYATITDKSDTTFTVKGMEVNDINFRGNFSFGVSEETELVWRYTAIECSDLEVGDNISITFTGDITETDPAGISEVLRLQLLDDEK